MDWEVSGESKGGGSSKVPGGKKKGRGKIVLIAIVAIVVLALAGRACSGGKDEKLDWPTTGLAAMLPDPPSEYGDVNVFDSSLSATFEQVEANDFADYVQACKDKGFTVDAKENGSSYEAYNEEGYALGVVDYSDSMSVSLDEPIEMAEIAWPTSGAASLVPAPKSTYGKIVSESSTHFSVTVGKTDREAYEAYIEACKSAGFTVDYDKGDSYFNASDAGGNKVRVDYKGFNMMGVQVDAAEEDSAAESQEQATSDAATAEQPAAQETSQAASSSDARAAIDEYEKFIDEYIAFMTKYKDDGNPVSMLVDYTKMMKRYSDMTDKFSKLNDGSLSAEDSAYYLEVQTRVTQKLADAAL